MVTKIVTILTKYFFLNPTSYLKGGVEVVWESGFFSESEFTFWKKKKKTGEFYSTHWTDTLNGRREYCLTD